MIPVPSSRRRLSALGGLPIAAALAFGALGCGSSSNNASSSASTPSSTPAASTPATTPATAPAPTGAPGKSIAVTLAEYTVTPTPAVGKAGRVTFNVANKGGIQHEFVVIKTPKPAAALTKGSEANEAGKVGESGTLAPGASKVLSLKLAPGHYALICNLPGHYAAGQHTDFTVR